MAPGETENNVYSNFWGDKAALWYVMVFFGVVNRSLSSN